MDKRFRWKKVTEIKAGDLVHSWGDWLEILEVKVYSDTVSIHYADGDVIKSATYNKDNELMVPTEDEMDSIAGIARAESERIRDAETLLALIKEREGDFGHDWELSVTNYLP